MRYELQIGSMWGSLAKNSVKHNQVSQNVLRFLEFGVIVVICSCNIVGIYALLLVCGWFCMYSFSLP
jgi:hypothetical protein